MQVIYERCAGLTIRNRMVEVCVLILQTGGTVEKLLRNFSTRITDLLALEEWLGSLSIERVVMESTGEHWYLVYNLLEDGRHILPIQPQQLKALSGRKTDIHDCEWLADLLLHDQLKAGFVSPEPIRELPDLLRYRKMLLAERASEFNHLQKILEGTTVSLETIISEQHDAKVLKELAHGYLRPLFPALHLALAGQEHLYQQFLLQRIVTHVETCEDTLTGVQREIEQRLALFEELVTLLQSIPGMHLMAAIGILSEVGTDMSRFPTYKHLIAWAGVSSNSKQNGSRLLSDATTSGNRHLQVILNDVAKSIAHSEEANYLTMLYTRTVYWGGKRRAIREVAHTVLMITYYVIRDKKMYRDGADYSDKRNAVYSGQYNNRRSKGLRYTVPLAHPVQATRETRALFSAVETRSNVWRLFCIWAWIGLTSFGGGASSIFLIQREFIEKRNWVSSKEFSHFWNLCGVTPGTSQIALSILIGQKLAGTPGLIASMVGLVLPSAVVTYLLAAGFQRIESIPIMQAIWRGIIPATSGLMFLVALRLAQPLIAQGRQEGRPALTISLVMILACVIAIIFFKITIIVVLLAASLAGIILFTTVRSRSRE